MAGPYPILQNGMGAPQGIWDVGATQHLAVGTRAHLTDGRVYYYARSVGATPLVAGNVLQSETVSVDMDDLATTADYAIGTKTINVTPVGTAVFAENALAGGYMIVNSGTGIGIAYKIDGNAVTTAATAFDVILKDGLAVAFGTATVTIAKNPWMDVVVSATGTAQLHVGVSNVAVPDGSTDAQFFWVQTWGVCAVTDGDTTTIGESIMGDATTAGETIVADGTQQPLGVQMFTGVNADASPVFLTIAP